jgi:alpha-tubulin suppressor-like RCC1 family protein
MRSPLLLAVLAPACAFDAGGVTPPDADPIDADPCAAVEVEAEAAHTCARTGDGAVWCWGDNASGQAGAATDAICPASGQTCAPSPVRAEGVAGIVDLALGETHSCAVDDGREVACWGADLGQLTVRAGAVEVVGGEAYTCGRDGGGVVSCAGLNLFGELGDGSTEGSEAPVSVPGIRARALGGGYRMVCAVLDDRQVACWGFNDLGQIDPETAGEPVRAPHLIEGVTGAVAVAVGLRHACALRDDGAGLCWGVDEKGQRFVGAPVPGPVDAIAAAVDHTCVLRGGEVACWGEGYPGDTAASAVVIALPGPAAQITAGSYHDCALIDAGAVWCWGANGHGQLGDGTFEDRAEPVQAAICR